MIVVPDTGSIQLPGASAERGTKHKGGEGSEGLRGLKSLGVRDLKHRMAFLACNVISCSMKLGEKDTGSDFVLQIFFQSPHIFSHERN